MNDNAFALIVERLLPQRGVTEANHSPCPHSPDLTYIVKKQSSKETKSHHPKQPQNVNNQLKYVNLK